MRVILNLVWLIVAGVELALAYVLAGLLLFVTIVGIPFGVQAFKLAGFALWPFGRVVVKSREAGVWAGIGNVLWVLLAGWWLVLAHVITAIALFLTIIGIPLGIANLKLTGLALFPFGREVVDRSTLGRLPEDAYAVR